MDIRNYSLCDGEWIYGFTACHLVNGHTEGLCVDERTFAFTESVLVMDIWNNCVS